MQNIIQMYETHVVTFLLVSSCLRCCFCTGRTAKFEMVSGASCRPAEGTELHQIHAQSVIQCTARCLERSGCRSVAFSTNLRQCLLYDVVWTPEQCVSTEGWRAWNSDKCVNGGQVLPDGTCRCFNGYVGDHCKRLMEDCAEAKSSPHYPHLGKGTKQQRHLLARPRLSPRAVAVSCRTSGDTMILQKTTNNTFGSFNVTWQIYVSGLASPEEDGDFFMSLEDLYYFTNSKQYQLTITISLHNGTKIRFTYNDFRITDMTFYTLSLGNFPKASMQQYDLLSNSAGQKFSTKDNDHDNVDDRNCAAEYGGGWWYNGCPDYNVMGWVAGEGESVVGKHYLFYQPLAAGTVKFLRMSLAT